MGDRGVKLVKATIYRC